MFGIAFRYSLIIFTLTFLLLVTSIGVCDEKEGRPPITIYYYEDKQDADLHILMNIDGSFADGNYRQAVVFVCDRDGKLHGMEPHVANDKKPANANLVRFQRILSGLPLKGKETTKQPDGIVVKTLQMAIGVEKADGNWGDHTWINLIDYIRSKTSGKETQDLSLGNSTVRIYRLDIVLQKTPGSDKAKQLRKLLSIAENNLNGEDFSIELAKAYAGLINTPVSSSNKSRQKNQIINNTENSGETQQGRQVELNEKKHSILSRLKPYILTLILLVCFIVVIVVIWVVSRIRYARLNRVVENLITLVGKPVSDVSLKEEINKLNSVSSDIHQDISQLQMNVSSETGEEQLKTDVVIQKTMDRFPKTVKSPYSRLAYRIAELAEVMGYTNLTSRKAENGIPSLFENVFDVEKKLANVKNKTGLLPRFLPEKSKFEMDYLDKQDIAIQISRVLENDREKLVGVVLEVVTRELSKSQEQLRTDLIHSIVNTAIGSLANVLKSKHSSDKRSANER